MIWVFLTWKENIPHLSLAKARATPSSGWHCEAPDKRAIVDVHDQSGLFFNIQDKVLSASPNSHDLVVGRVAALLFALVSAFEGLIKSSQVTLGVGSTVTGSCLSLNWPWTHNSPPPLASQVLGLQASITTPSFSSVWCPLYLSQGIGLALFTLQKV